MASSRIANVWVAELYGECTSCTRFSSAVFRITATSSTIPLFVKPRYIQSHATLTHTSILVDDPTAALDRFPTAPAVTLRKA